MGVWWVVAGCLLGLVTAFGLRTRLPGLAVAALLAASGGLVGWGGMLLQPDPPLGQVVFAVAVLAALVPFHVRVVLGSFGSRRDGDQRPAAG